MKHPPNISALVRLREAVPENWQRISNHEIKLWIELSSEELFRMNMNFGEALKHGYLSGPTGVKVVSMAAQEISTGRLSALIRALEDCRVFPWIVVHSAAVDQIDPKELKHLDAPSKIEEWIPEAFKAISRQWDQRFVDRYGAYLDLAPDIRIETSVVKAVRKRLATLLGDEPRKASRPRKQELVLAEINRLYPDGWADKNSKEILKKLDGDKQAEATLGGKVSESTVRRALGRKK